MSKYPESEKLAENGDLVYEIADFIEWVTGETGALQGEDPQDLAQRYLGIDSRKLEAERRQMLEEARWAL